MSQTTTTHNLATYADIGCEFEEIQLAVKQISDILSVYTESVDMEMSGLRKNPALWGQNFVNRHDRLFTILRVLEEHVDGIIERLDGDISTAYRVSAAMK